MDYMKNLFETDRTRWEALHEANMQRFHIENTERWREWIDEIPVLQFPSEWFVRVIPPHGGALVRFQVHLDEAFVSVYLDCYDHLGFFGAPYWEAYPYPYEYEDEISMDTFRCGIKEDEALLSAILRSLNHQLGRS